MLSGALFSVLMIAGACGEDSTAAAKPDAAPASPEMVGEGICPARAPDAGEGCLLPEGTTCAFGTCSIAQCTRGAWRYSGNPEPQPLCPDPDPPASDSVCPPCWDPSATCAYGSEDCTKADASANRTVASCPNGLWVLEFFPCAPMDAGADVQGDAGADSD